MMKRSALSILGCALLAGCVQSGMEPPAPKKAYIGAVPVMTRTPVDAALACLSTRPEVKRFSKVFGVHIVSDQTQRFNSEETGGFVPRDSAGMLVSLLQKAGVKQVNRSNTAVSEWEIAKAREQILGDGGNTTVGNQTLPFRPLVKGTIRGSDYVIDGAITQLDFNTYSDGIEASVGGLGGGARSFAITAAIDLRVTDTRTTRIVKAESYSKQAVGHEVFASVFRFFSDELFDVKIGGKNQEGLQAAIRWVLADATYDIVSDLTKHDGSCDTYLPKASQADKQSNLVAVLKKDGALIVK